MTKDADDADDQRMLLEMFELLSADPKDFENAFPQGKPSAPAIPRAYVDEGPADTIDEFIVTLWGSWDRIPDPPPRPRRRR